MPYGAKDLGEYLIQVTRVAESTCRVGDVGQLVQVVADATQVVDGLFLDTPRPGPRNGAQSDRPQVGREGSAAKIRPSGELLMFVRREANGQDLGAPVDRVGPAVTRHSRSF